MTAQEANKAKKTVKMKYFTHGTMKDVRMKICSKTVIFERYSLERWTYYSKISFPFDDPRQVDVLKEKYNLPEEVVTKLRKAAQQKEKAK